MRDFAAIFRHAWEVARKGAITFGGKPREYFRESLQQVYSENRRNVTARDMVKIMRGRSLSTSQIRREVNARFIEQSSKNIARRVWDMIRSPHVTIESEFCPETKRKLYRVVRVRKKFFQPGAITRALKSPPKVQERKPVTYKRPAMAPQEINACRLANAFHQALRTRNFIAPQLIEGIK